MPRTRATSYELLRALVYEQTMVPCNTRIVLRITGHESSMYCTRITLSFGDHAVLAAEYRSAYVSLPTCFPCVYCAFIHSIGLCGTLRSVDASSMVFRDQALRCAAH